MMIRTTLMFGMLALASPGVAQESAPPAPAQTPPATGDIAGAVAADWAKYDQGGKGHLTQAEFSTWLTALRTSSSGGAADDPAKVKAWADGSFPEADANSDAEVTPEELTAFLQTKTKK